MKTNASVSLSFYCGCFSTFKVYEGSINKLPGMHYFFCVYRKLFTRLYLSHFGHSSFIVTIVATAITVMVWLGL